MRRTLHQLQSRLRVALTPHSIVRSGDVAFRLNCDTWITQFRMETFHTKEPETLDWIDTWLKDDDLLFDVGGNIGIYSLYAAIRHPRLSVVVFEPEYANLHLLRDNIVDNGLSERIHVYPIALSNRTGMSHLYVQDLTPGSALHTESAKRLTTTESGRPVVLSEGVWAMQLDDFCAEVGLWPNALKIDVDGGEGRVLAGAKKALSQSNLRSVLVEVEGTASQSDVHQALETAGLRRIESRRPPSTDNQIWARPQAG